MFWQLNILIPRTRWTKSDWSTYIPNLNNFSFSHIVDYFVQTVVTLMSIGNTFQDIKFFFQNNYWFTIWKCILSKKNAIENLGSDLDFHWINQS